MSPSAPSLLDETRALLRAAPDCAAILQLDPTALQDFPSLAAALLSGLALNPALAAPIARVYRDAPGLIEITDHDIRETARRNVEPGGPAATLVFSRGAQAVMAHRVAHQLWTSGQHSLALAVKSALGRALCTDIHPAARIGAGFWLDHGLGCVIGETSVIGEDVSIWHNVTLGSSLTNASPDRHPQIGDRVVIGAGAILLGRIQIGAGANIAAGAIVLSDVPEATTFAGQKAVAKGPAKVSFQRRPE
jgi:serine O-acetyltransferase